MTSPQQYPVNPPRRYMVFDCGGVFIVDTSRVPALPIAIPCMDAERMADNPGDARTELLAVAQRIARLMNDEEDLRVAVSGVLPPSPPTGI